MNQQKELTTKIDNIKDKALKEKLTEDIKKKLEIKTVNK
jgi:hypothetical protein